MNELFAFLFACVLIGIWGLKMFCDSPYLDFSRAIRPTKNTTALTIPTFGSLMLVIAAAKTLEMLGKTSQCCIFFCSYILRNWNIRLHCLVISD